MESILITYIVLRNISLIYLSNLFPLIFYLREFLMQYILILFSLPLPSPRLSPPYFMFFLSLSKKIPQKAQKNGNQNNKPTRQNKGTSKQKPCQNKTKETKKPPPNTHKQTNPMEFILRCPTTPGRGARSGGNGFILFQLVLIASNFWIGSGIPRPRPPLSAGLMHAAIVYKLLWT